MFCRRYSKDVQKDKSNHGKNILYLIVKDVVRHALFKMYYRQYSEADIISKKSQLSEIYKSLKFRYCIKNVPIEAL